MQFVPCRDHCYIRYGKQYTKECDTTCDYAKVCLENKDMLNTLLKHRIKRNKDLFIRHFHQF